MDTTRLHKVNMHALNGRDFSDLAVMFLRFIQPEFNIKLKSDIFFFAEIFGLAENTNTKFILRLWLV